MSQEEDGSSSLNRSEFPYKVEYAASARAKCRKCGEKIEKSELKLSYLMPSRFHSGQDAFGHHLKCFFQVKRPKSIAEIKGFNSLKFEDQQLIEKAVQSAKVVLGTSPTEDDGETKGKKKKKGKKRGAKEPIKGPNDDTIYEDFRVEEAKSGRATCRGCLEKIEKGEVRIAYMDYEPTDVQVIIGQPVPRWHHIDCFIQAADMVGFCGNIGLVPGFKELQEEEKEILVSKFKAITEASMGVAKKVKKEPKKELTDVELKEIELLKKQSKKFHEIREELSKLKTKELQEILDANNQKIRLHGKPEMLDYVADMLQFGAMVPCGECGGSFKLSASAYICRGGSDGTSCSVETTDPLREEPVIPDEIVDKYEYFQNTYRFREGKRIFASSMKKAVEKKEQAKLSPTNPEGPLRGLLIGVSQWKNLKPGKELIEAKLNDLGATAHMAFNSKLFVMLASKEEFESNSPKIEAALDAGIPVVSPSFLFKLKSVDQLPKLLEESLLSEWNGDFTERYAKLTVKKEK